MSKFKLGSGCRHQFGPDLEVLLALRKRLGQGTEVRFRDIGWKSLTCGNLGETWSPGLVKCALCTHALGSYNYRFLLQPNGPNTVRFDLKRVEFMILLA